MEEPGRLQSMGSLRESDMTGRLHFHFSLSCIGEGNGNPLQCSCLENPRDGEAWWGAIFGVAQSRTRLKQLSSSSGSFTYTCVCVCVCVCVFVNVQKCSCWILWQIYVWLFKKLPKHFPEWLCHFICPISMCKWSDFFAFSTAFGIVTFLFLIDVLIGI